MDAHTEDRVIQHLRDERQLLTWASKLLRERDDAGLRELADSFDASVRGIDTLIRDAGHKPRAGVEQPAPPPPVEPPQP